MGLGLGSTSGSHLVRVRVRVRAMVRVRVRVRVMVRVRVRVPVWSHTSLEWASSIEAIVDMRGGMTIATRPESVFIDLTRVRARDRARVRVQG